MQSTVAAGAHRDPRNHKGRTPPGIWSRRLFRCGCIAAVSLVRCLPLLLARRPRTPLRVLCIGAFEYLGRLRGGRLDHTRRTALAYACDFGALRNDFYDQRELDRSFYRELRQSLRLLAPKPAIHRYIRELRQTERERPAFGPDGFPEPARVVEYRLRVIVLSLTWLVVVSRRSIEPSLFRALVALVGLVQLVDDLLDWKDDWASRRPTYVTAFLRNWTRLSESRAQIHLHANRFRGVLLSACEQDLEAAPLMLAGVFVWVLAVMLIRIRLPR